MNEEVPNSAEEERVLEARARRMGAFVLAHLVVVAEVDN